MNGLIEGKKYVLSTQVDTVITDVKYNIPLGTVKAGQQYVFQAVSDAVTVADGCTIRPFEGSNGASVGVVGGGSEGGSSGGSSAYPGWVGYIEYDDETGEAIAADYSGLEIGGTVPESLRFNKIKFKGDWKGSIGKFTKAEALFHNCTNLTSFNGDLSSLKDGFQMFLDCTNLESFNGDLSSLTNSHGMFHGCKNLTSFTSDDLSSLTNGQQMFGGCKKLASFSSNLSSLTNSQTMFYDCKNLTSFTSGDLSSLTNGSYMFQYCNNLTSFNCDDLSSMTNGTSMFHECSNLESFNADLSSLTDGGNMFYDCNNLTSFNADLSSLTNGYQMFGNCNLDAASVERILTTIPEYSDGIKHSLSMRIQSGEAATKFGEITGTIPTPSQINVKFKGWTITVNTKN